MSSQAGAIAVLTRLLHSGVTRFVLCPGSRSAPLAYALRELEVGGAISLHVETDERSAGFLALGLGKASGTPSAVITTSGSAVANLHPAAVEAYHGGVPLIALTADRPAAMRGSGANQTTDQVGLLGPGLVGQIDLSAEDIAEQPGLLDGVLERVWRGPVHINLSFDSPLTPERTSFRQSPDIGQFSTPAAQHEPVFLDDRPTVIVAGPGTPYADILGRTGYGTVPILAEPAAAERCNGIPAGRIVAQEFDPQIERVITVGHPTLSRLITSLISRTDIEVYAVQNDPVPTDPGGVATILPVMPHLSPQGEWLATWQAAGEAAHRAGREVLDEDFDALTASAVIADAEGDWFLGASNIIRDVDLLAGNPVGRFHASRGLAGIDGTMSTARGMSHVLGGMKVAVGDLAFVHDLGGLVLTAGQEEPPLDVVVIDDSGGGIFATLEHGQTRYESAFDRVFRTAKSIDITGAARAFGWQGIEVGSANELADILAQAPARRILRVACERTVDQVRTRRAHVSEVMADAARHVRSPARTQ